MFRKVRLLALAAVAICMMAVAGGTASASTVTVSPGGVITATFPAGGLVLSMSLFTMSCHLVLTGSLGAGKTTLAQGIGAGLDVRGAVTSPTFVIARVHPSLDAGPALVHVDAYRLGGRVEVDDLDLDASLDDSVTLVEWGEGLVEELSPNRLEIEISRTENTPGAEAPAGLGGADVQDGAAGGDGADARPRQVRIVARGERWRDVDLTPVAG